jgi:hypothetical protein
MLFSQTKPKFKRVQIQVWGHFKFLQALNLSNIWNPNFNQIWLIKVIGIFIQVLFQNLKSSNKESYSLFNSLQFHILFEIFLAPEGHLLTISNKNAFGKNWINKKSIVRTRPVIPLCLRLPHMVTPASCCFPSPVSKFPSPPPCLTSPLLSRAEL